MIKVMDFTINVENQKFSNFYDFLENWLEHIPKYRLSEFFDLWFNKEKRKELSYEGKLGWFKVFGCSLDTFDWLFEDSDPKKMNTRVKLYFLILLRKLKKINGKKKIFSNL